MAQRWRFVSQTSTRVFLPLTKAFDTNTMWVESLPGLGDFKPLNLEYGEVFMGYLNQCRHGNKDNETGKTRVSFDFRVIPGFAYDDTCTKVTCTTKSPFLVGGYYEKMEMKLHILLMRMKTIS
jgi:ectoine hydroxylase-related dioxygenase (phytanoyl-CoA dioxygenase family)